MATDDLTLVQRARSGDERAFRQLVERYQRKVYSVALGMLIREGLGGLRDRVLVRM